MSGINTRRLKVYYGYHSGSNKRRPVIRLGGDYLSLQGFKVGDMVEVTIQTGQILITKVECPAHA